MPDSFEADRRRRPVAGLWRRGGQIAARLAPVVEVENVVVAGAPAPLVPMDAEEELDRRPCAAPSPSAWPSGAGSRGRTWSATSTMAAFAAQAAHRLGQLYPHRTGAQDQQTAWARLSCPSPRVAAPDAVELTQARPPAAPPGREPVATTTCSRGVACTPSTSTTPGPSESAVSRVPGRCRHS